MNQFQHGHHADHMFLTPTKRNLEEDHACEGGLASQLQTMYSPQNTLLQKQPTTAHYSWHIIVVAVFTVLKFQPFHHSKFSTFPSFKQFLASP